MVLGLQVCVLGPVPGPDEKITVRTGRAGVVIAALLVSFPAQAVPCWVVKKAVAQYGEAAVESWAMSKRIPERGIEKARRCLK